MTDIDKLIERLEKAAKFGGHYAEAAQALRELRDGNCPPSVYERNRELLLEVDAKQARIEVLEGALREISEGKGRYSMDPLEHAGNTIEDMKELAKEALATESSDG